MFNLVKLGEKFVLRNCKWHSLARYSSNKLAGSETESWQVHSYGGLEELRRNACRIPVLSKPDSVLIEVHAASVNPLDVAMVGGYGAGVLNVLRKAESCDKNVSPELPITLGRDFAGTVVAKGQNVDKFNVGDEVWGVLSPHLQGAHARIIAAPSSCVARKPENLSMVESASLVYAAMTAWSSLQVTGGLAVLGASGRKVLILGGAGGVGCQAVQLLLAWGSNVTATCSGDAVPLVQALGVHNVINYSQTDLHQRLAESGKYDVILDCAGLGTDGGKEYFQHLSDNPMAKFITLKSPLLKEIDGKGLVGGALSSLTSLIQANLQPGLLPRLAPVRWGFFMPLPPALHDIGSLANQGKLKPCIDTIFTFDDVPKAFAKLQSGHARGKIVINMIDKSCDKNEPTVSPK